MIDTRVIFEEAHTHNGWQDKPVPDDLLRRVYDRRGEDGADERQL